MQINNELIKEAERLLIGGNHFDNERIDFIKLLENCDLLAVPGSGKTTALQAKLYCLSKLSKNPTSKGILVLSHTNAAVEEIKKKLFLACPNLFDYPNFVGTVQDFVDKFLTIPFYSKLYGHGVTRIDNSIYKDEFRKEVLRKKIRNDKIWTWYQLKNIEQAVNYGLKVTVDGEEVAWNYSTNKEFQVAASKTPSTWIGREDDNRNHIKSILRELKDRLWEKGILSYEDCYVFAQMYINQYPRIKDIVRKRFQYVFIDETQDLQGHQLEITDQLFNYESACFQRIGDINQSIFHAGVDSTDCLWMPRNPRTLNNSLRLSPNIAAVVDAFMLCREPGQVVTGLRNVNPVINPYIFVYDYEHKDFLKTKFEELIELNGLDNLPESKYGYHIVGWNSKWSDNKDHIPTDLRLSDLYTDFVSKDISANSYMDCLAEYIAQSKRLKDNKQRIHCINAVICECLRLCGKLDRRIIGGHVCERPYTLTSLQEYLQSSHVEIEHEYRLKELDIIRKMNMSHYHDAYDAIKNMIHWVIDSLGCITTKEYEAFISMPYNIDDDEIQQNKSQIHIETVHRAKGQTHCATLYIETIYQGKYESMHVHNRIAKIKTKTRPAVYCSNPFFKETGTPQKNSYAKNAMKMVYVGLSRPTHLLCYAMHKSSYEKYDVDRLKDCGWHIIDLTINHQ